MDNADELEELRRGQIELLERVEGTYLLLHQSRRRLAVFALVMAVIFGAVAAQFAVRYFDARQAAELIEDRALFEGFGIRIPDPEPAFLRVEMRARATISGFLALVSAGIATAWLLGAAIAMPPAPGKGDHTAGRPPDRTRHASTRDSAPPRG